MLLSCAQHKCTQGVCRQDLVFVGNEPLRPRDKPLCCYTIMWFALPPSRFRIRSYRFYLAIWLRSDIEIEWNSTCNPKTLTMIGIPLCLGYLISVRRGWRDLPSPRIFIILEGMKVPCVTIPLPGPWRVRCLDRADVPHVFSWPQLGLKSPMWFH